MGAVPETRHVDLCIIGSGSANSIPDERFDDWSIALVEGGHLRRHLPQRRLHPDQDVRPPGRPGPHARARRHRSGSTSPSTGSGGARSGTASSAGSTRSRRPGSATGRRAATSACSVSTAGSSPTTDCGSPTAPRSPRTGSCIAAGSRVRIPDDRRTGRHPVRDLRHRDAAARAAPVDDHRRRRVRGRGVRPRVLRVRHRGHRGRAQRHGCCGTRTPTISVPLHDGRWPSASTCGCSTTVTRGPAHRPISNGLDDVGTVASPSISTVPAEPPR